MAKVAFRSEDLYHAFRLDPDSEVVRFALDRAAAAGLQPSLRISNAGLDANWFVRHGLPMVTFGVGQRNIHSTAEHLDLADFFASCRLALSLARA
jgi:tripeptide aminopeptidase